MDILNNFKNSNGPVVQQPDNTNLKATGSGNLPLSKDLTRKAQKAYVLPILKSALLIALGQLCNDKCKVVSSKDHLNVTKKTKLSLKDIEINKMTCGTFRLPKQRWPRIMFTYYNRILEFIYNTIAVGYRKAVIKHQRPEQYVRRTQRSDSIKTMAYKTWTIFQGRSAFILSIGNSNKIRKTFLLLQSQSWIKNIKWQL